ncbi:hypothetical protein OB905_13405 [Halobacteria archaeon AArc-dxtr1]|nr:hypothetical protein [Halobacteria archaeon AArc-dxtr1]
MLTARDAVGVLFDLAVLKLLLVVLLGRWMIATSAPIAAGVDSAGLLPALSSALASATVLVGYVLYYGAALALLVKLVYEATALADSR